MQKRMYVSHPLPYTCVSNTNVNQIHMYIFMIIHVNVYLYIFRHVSWSSCGTDRPVTSEAEVSEDFAALGPAEACQAERGKSQVVKYI